MIVLRTIGLALLAVAMMLGSVSLAVARNQPRPVGMIVLCTGHGATSVAVDARGQPVNPQFQCPECAPGLAALTDAPAIMPAAPPRILRAPAYALRCVPAPRAAAPVPHRSRAPPVVI
ncbi:MAG: hypothetical protein HLUCCA12_06610 [Rhodobacteraceae bacterium HLUCCA12]|nr:MAG: hypothetical protein HLUCCA12_06610 [Rhodobacteraceae bacterium HLUCCA12]